MIEARDGLFKALPLDVSDPAKLTYLLDRLIEHESEWTDFQADMRERRIIASNALAHALSGKNSCVLEVWQLDAEPSIVGLVGYTDIVPGVDCQWHPVFFDGKIRNLAGKRELLLRSVDWAFGIWGLHRVSLQLVENAYALIKFARMKLGFRFEGENRTIRQQRVVPHGHISSRKVVALTPGWREAEYGSRRYQAIWKSGQWWDVILLSVTREEFADVVRKAPTCHSSSTDPVPDSPSPKT